MLWTQFVTSSQIIKFVLQTTKTLVFKRQVVNYLPSKTKAIITHYSEQSNTSAIIWIEFSAPKHNGFVEGTYIALIKKDEIQLLESYGLHNIQSSQVSSVGIDEIV